MSTLSELKKELSKLKKKEEKQKKELQERLDKEKVQKEEISSYNDKIRKKRKRFLYGYFLYLFIVPNLPFIPLSHQGEFNNNLLFALTFAPLFYRFIFSKNFQFKESVSGTPAGEIVDKREIERNISKIEREIQLRKKYPKESDDGIYLMMRKSFYVGMSREQLIDSKGRPEDIKSSYKNNVETEKFYYGGRTTRVKTKKYSLEITLKNNEIVGYKEL